MSLKNLIKKPVNPSTPTTVSGVEPSMYPSDKIAPRKVYVIKADRWDKNLPYYFSILRSDPSTGATTLGNRITDFEKFPLPINPSNIQISIPFAINVLATTRGILEEHNGTIFRNITVQGTTGVVPNRLRSGGFDGPGSTGGIGGIAERGAIALAANTIGGVRDTLNAFQRTLTAATGDLPDLESGTDEVNIWQFGHAQLHLLLNYFVAYSEYKKQSGRENQLARLAFISQKDNTAYVCTPISFDVTKSADNPHQFNYRIVLKAWDLADTTSGISPDKNQFGFESLANNPNLLSRIFQTTREARSVISAAQSSIRAIASDFENAYNIVGEVLLAVKELGGFGRTIADFNELVESRWSRIAADFDTKVSDISAEFGGGNSESSQRQQNVLTSTKALSDAAASTNNSADPTNPGGLPVSGVSQQTATTTQKKRDIQNPLNRSSSLITHTDYLDQHDLEEFTLTDTEEENVDIKVRKATSFSIADYDAKRRVIEAIRDAYADSRGLNDDDYDNTVGRTTIQGLKRSPVSQDYQIIKSFNDIISTIDAMSATNELIKQQIPDPFIRAQETVSGSGIVINQANSAFPVPFPFKGTLEKLASIYLGNPDRWIEIAILNKLKPPYIDEDGFLRNFSTSGSGNTFTLGNVTNLFLGQEVFLSSVTQREERREIVNIEKIEAGNFLITVDGDDDLSKFTTTHLAKMKAYLPNTVNSKKIIFIPLGIEIPDNSNLPDTREIPATRQLNAQEKLMGVDIALTDDFDLAVNSTGDVNIATGLANAIQAIKLKLSVEPGQLKHHQEYGAGLPIGERQEFTAQDIKQFLEQAISQDPRFAELPDISVSFEGPVVKLNLRVKVVNDGGVIPIQFTL